MSQDGTSALPMKKKLLYLLVPLAPILLVIAWIVYNWVRFSGTRKHFDAMVDGTCNITSTDYSALGLVPLGYTFEVIGALNFRNTCWTNVPCRVSLQAWDRDNNPLPVDGQVLLDFTYWQSYWAWDYMHDKCNQLVPKAAGQPFTCAYELGGDGKIDNEVYFGTKDRLPDYPMLFLVRACTLSFWVGLPVALLFCMCLRNSIKKRPASARAMGNGAREHLLAVA